VAFTLCSLLIAWCVPGLRSNVLGFARQAHAVRQTLKIDIAGAVRSANIHHALVFIREPFNGRVAHRLWGLGMTRSQAAQLIASRDGCALLSAVRAAEVNRAPRRPLTAADLARTVEPFVESEQNVHTSDSRVLISSPASLDPACRAELQTDMRIGGAAFGPALPLEPIGKDGRIDGDVIYVADLGEKNAVLRTRFGDRVWYRLLVRQTENGQARAMVAPF